MKKYLLLIGLITSITGYLRAQYEGCATDIIAPSFEMEQLAALEEKQVLAKKEWQKDPNNADALIWYGRRTAYLGKYIDAIELFTEGIERHPSDARFYRHRGHRYITIRCFDKAIADFEKAVALIKGKPDQIEPDGMPNAKNIPTSTLQSNIWYHLGLAYYIKGDYEKAMNAYRECLKVSKNPDMYVATANWLYITYRQMGETKQAAKLLATIKGDEVLIENEDYFKILLCHKEVNSADELRAKMTQANTLSNASLGFGLGMYYLLNGRKDDAKAIFRRITEGSQWSSFGYIAAEEALKRL